MEIVSHNKRERLRPLFFVFKRLALIIGMNRGKEPYDKRKIKKTEKGGTIKMNKKVKHSLLTLMTLSQIAPIFIAPVNVVQAETYTMTTKATERLNNVKNAVSEMEASPNNNTIKQAMDAFTKLYFGGGSDEEGDMAIFTNGHSDDPMNRIIKTLNRQDGNTKNQLTVHFFNQMGLRYGNDQAFYYEDHLNKLLDNTTDQATNDRLMQAAGQLNHLLRFKLEDLKSDSNGNYFHVSDGNLKLTNPLDQTPDAEALKPEPVGTIQEDSSIPGGLEEPSEEEVSPMDDTWEDVFYEVVDGKTTRIRTVYTRVNGVVTSQEFKETVSLSEAFAGTEDDWAILNEGALMEDGVGDLISDVDEEAESERSNMTLHYTVTKGTDDVYYYDTGMRVTADEHETASYQQVKDVLYQMAIRAEGFLAEDNGKFLIVVEGKPVLIREEKETYTKAEIEEMFKEFGAVEVRIMPTRIGTTASLEEQLLSGTEQTVQVNGEDANLKHHPLIEDGQVLLSIEELAGLLDLTFEKTTSKYTVSNDKHSIVYEENVKAVTIDGKVKELTTPSILNKEGALMGDIAELLELFDVDMVWDEENSMILLQTN